MAIHPKLLLNEIFERASITKIVTSCDELKKHFTLSAVSRSHFSVLTFSDNLNNKRVFAVTKKTCWFPHPIALDTI